MGADGAPNQRQSVSASGRALKPAHIGTVATRATVPGYNVNLTVVAMEGSDGVGATATPGSWRWAGRCWVSASTANSGG